MSFPSLYGGRCIRCGGPFPKGALIDYDKTTKSAWHAGCPLQEALPTEAMEPGEIEPAPAPIPPTRPTTRKKKLQADTAWARTVEHGRADVVICCRCGGSSKVGGPMLHKSCIDADDAPF
jgi:hypothetical protein